MNGITIIIPTRNRPDLLKRTLSTLEKSGECPESTEIIVVDDGSDENTRRKESYLVNTMSLSVTLIMQPPKGPAAARNRGIRAANNPIVLFLGDDILPAPHLTRIHLEHHGKYPQPTVAVLGRVTWDPDLEVTPLMAWLENGGPQFRYNDISDPNNVPSSYFWTANVSAKRDFILSVGGFNERFPDAAFEDVELGVRLARKGLILHYREDALGYHHHPMDLKGSLDRMNRLARGACIAADTIPDMIYLENDHPLKRIRRRLVLNQRMLNILYSINPIAVSLPGFRKRYFRFIHDLYYRAALRRLLKCP